MKSYLFELFLIVLIDVASSTLPQEILHPEINDQFENATSTTTVTNKPLNYIDDEQNEIFVDFETTDVISQASEVKDNIFSKIYNTVKGLLKNFLATPKINMVLRNVGTCIVNGVMEIVSYYFPAPLIPLIASAAGMVIPFEPVVMLRRRMPVTSYRRAIKTAVNSFLNTFNPYKFDNYDEDPYMTRRFNRRFMNDVSKEEKNQKTADSPMQ